MDSYKHSVGACQSFREMNPQTNEQTFNIFSSASFKSRAGGSGEVSKGLSVPAYFQGRCCTCWSGGLRDNSSHLLLYTPSCCSTDPQTTDQNMSWALNASRWRRWARHSATPAGVPHAPASSFSSCWRYRTENCWPVLCCTWISLLWSFTCRNTDCLMQNSCPSFRI